MEPYDGEPTVLARETRRMSGHELRAKTGRDSRAAAGVGRQEIRAPGSRASSGVDGPAGARLLGAAPYFGALAAPGQVIQRQEADPPATGWGADGWNAGTTEVDPRGRVPGEEGFEGADAVRRVPLPDVSSVVTEQVIALVPAPGVLAETRPLDVLVHCHGAHAQSRPRPNRPTGSDDPDARRVNDLHVGQLSQQLAASGVAMVGIVAQLRHHGGEEFDLGPMVGDVYGRLQALGLIAADQNPGRVIISAHSLGSRTALDEAEALPGPGGADEELPGELRGGGLFLFDPYLYDSGERHRRQDPGHPQWERLRTFLRGRFDGDVTALRGLPDAPARRDYLGTRGFVFRGYAREGSATYGDAMGHLRTTLSGWIEGLGTAEFSTLVLADLARNYEVQLQTPGGGGDRHSASVTAPDARNQVTTREDQDGNGRWVRDYAPGRGNLEDAVGDYADRSRP